MKLFSWIYPPSGNCPVQAEGHFLGHYFYFRARWDTASIEFTRTEADWENSSFIRRFVLKYYPAPTAGWISKREALRLIVVGCAAYTIPRIGFALGLVKAWDPTVPPAE